jgi:hypothetical protein
MGKLKPVSNLDAPDIIRSGGMRGIVELETIRAIEDAMEVHLPIQCFFDLIVGTRYVFVVD